MIAAGASPWLAIAAGAFGGLLAGIVTGILYTKLKIPAILAGILTMIALYSVNLHVMGKANISLLRVDTIFSTTASLLHVSNSVAAFLVPAVLLFLCSAFIYWFFGTELGMCIRATGYNTQMVRAQGVNTDLHAFSLLFVVFLGVDSFSASLAAVILGSVIYRVVIAVVLYMGMPPNDLKLFTAIIVVLALAAPMIKGKVNVGK